MSEQNPSRIQFNGRGVGEISDEDLERRALEFAKMDGRTQANSLDRANARDEILHPGPPPPPEADETERPVRLWSSAEAGEGHQAPRNGLEDEGVAEQLIEEGLEEADRDLRLSAQRVQDDRNILE